VNNVSMGLYAGLLGSRHYRRSKIRAALDELPAMLGRDASPLAVRFPGPEGTTQVGAHALLVSNNAYRLGGLGRNAWRPDLTAGTLGVLSVGVADGNAVARLALSEPFGSRRLPPGYARWTTDTFAVDTDGAVDAARDGEAVRVSGLLQFTVRPGALLVRLPASRRRAAVGNLVREAGLLIGAAAAAPPPSPSPARRR
jgi:diacylglycerol kinase family enzyme